MATKAAKALVQGDVINIRFYTGPVDGVTIEDDVVRVHTRKGTYRFQVNTRVKLA